MRFEHAGFASSKTPARWPKRYLAVVMFCVASLGVLASALIGAGDAYAAVALASAAQSPTTIAAGATADFGSIVFSGGGGTNDSVELSPGAITTGATFSDTGDGTNGCYTESGSAGSATETFSEVEVTTNATTTATGQYSFTVTADEYTTTNCTGSPISSPATTTLTLNVGLAPTLSLTSVPTLGNVGSTITGSSVQASLTNGTTSPAISGTITYTVFGPLAAAPTTCTSGGTSDGGTSVSGNGTYSAPSLFTPAVVGNYWWYASYSGDSSNTTATSTCGSSMLETYVAAGSPAIAWSTPSAIAYGTALSGTQLDATALVAGTFVYSPTLGTVLGAGANTLTATFYPTDTVDYTATSSTVSLAVTPAALQVTASSTTMPYGSIPPAVSASYTGFANGDSASLLTTAPTCTTSATKITRPGVDANVNTCSGAVDANYTFTYVPGNMTITAPVITSATKQVGVAANATSIRLTCAQALCGGTIELTGHRSGKVALLGSKSYSLSAGKTTKEKIALNATGRLLLAKVSSANSLRITMKIFLTAGTTLSRTVTAV